MKTAWVTGHRTVEIREMEMPGINETEVLVNIKAAGICGSDIGLFVGEHPFRKPPAMLGHEMAGVVVEVGSNTTKFKKGDRIAFNPIVNCGQCELCKEDIGNLCSQRQIAGVPGSRIKGTFAEYISVPETHLTLIADHVSFESGAMVEPFSVAVHALARFTGKKDSLLILGTGVIGLCSLLLAKSMGYKRIYCTNRGEYNRRVAVDCGATAAFNPLEVNLAEVLKEYEPNGIDACVLSVASQEIMNDLFACLKPRGEICYVYQNTNEIPTNFCPLVNNEFSIMGTTGETMNDFKAAADFVNNHTDMAEKLITHVMPLSESQQALELMENRTEPVIKIIVHPGE